MYRCFNEILIYSLIFQMQYFLRNSDRVRNAHQTRYHFKSINAISETRNNILIFRTFYLFEIKITHDHAQSRKPSKKPIISFLRTHTPKFKGVPNIGPDRHTSPFPNRCKRMRQTAGDYFRKRHVWLTHAL